MLRTNSKKAKENVRDYIMSIFNWDDFGVNLYEWDEVNAVIVDTFNSEMKYDYRYRRGDIYAVFVSWVQGLPSVINTADYFLHSTLPILGGILEETEEEQNRYSETDAENLLTLLIYRELFD